MLNQRQERRSFDFLVWRIIARALRIFRVSDAYSKRVLARYVWLVGGISRCTENLQHFSVRKAIAESVRFILRLFRFDRPYRDPKRRYTGSLFRTPAERGFVERRFPGLWLLGHVTAGAYWLMWLSLREYLRTKSVSEVALDDDPKVSSAATERTAQMHRNMIGLYLRAGQELSRVIRARISPRRAHVLLGLSEQFASLPSYVGLLPDAWLAFYRSEELMEAIRLGHLSLDYYASAEAEHGRHPLDRGIYAVRLRRSPTCGAALIHAYLGSAYLRSLEGDVGENIETAITHYERAVELLEREKLPELGARISVGLASLLLFFPTEQREAYAKKALELLIKACDTWQPYRMLTTRMAEDLTGRWHRAYFRSIPHRHMPSLTTLIVSGLFRGFPPQMLYEFIAPEFVSNLHWTRAIAHQRVGQIADAIEHFDKTLDLLPAANQEERAAIKVSKGLAYLAEASDPERARVRALECFREAASNCSEEAAPEIYAMALVFGVRTVREMTPEISEDTPIGGTVSATDFPGIPWAAARGLGIPPDSIDKAAAFIKRIPGLADLVPSGEQQDVVQTMRTAARIAARHELLSVARDALVTLADVFETKGDIKRAYGALACIARLTERRHETARRLRLKQHYAGGALPVYDRLIRVAHQRARSPATASRELVIRSALSMSERSRARFLQEELADRRLLPTTTTDPDLEAFFDLRRSLLHADLRVAELESSPRVAREDLLQTMRNTRNAIGMRYRNQLRGVRDAYGAPTYDPDMPLVPIRAHTIQRFVDALCRVTPTAFVEYHITDKELLVFVILPTADGERNEPVLASTGMSREELDRLADRWSEGLARLQDQGRPIHPLQWERGWLQPTLTALRGAAAVPHEVIEAWQDRTGVRIDRLILIPHRFLHLVPLHALSLPDGTMWGDRVCIQYAPSASVLWRLINLPRTGGIGGADRLYDRPVAICYSPHEDMSLNGQRSILFSAHEARAVVARMGGTLLERMDATPSRIITEMRDATYIHIACHGVFDPENPLEAGLELAADTSQQSTKSVSRLTLGDIFERVHLARSPLVMLSACSTGIVKTEKYRDEYLGLPAGFLYAGARTVISTLWRVSDLGTWLLTREFLERLAACGEPAEALRGAQRAVRGISSREATGRIVKAIRTEKDTRCRDQLDDAEKWLRDWPPDTCPFAGPYWWAGFTVTGLGAHSACIN